MESIPALGQSVGQDYDFQIKQAKQSKAFLMAFRDAVSAQGYPGKECATIAQGLHFLETMIAQASAQVDHFTRLAKEKADAPQS